MQEFEKKIDPVESASDAVLSDADLDQVSGGNFNGSGIFTSIVLNNYGSTPPTHGTRTPPPSGFNPDALLVPFNNLKKTP